MKKAAADSEGSARAWCEEADAWRSEAEWLDGALEELWQAVLEAAQLLRLHAEWGAMPRRVHVMMPGIGASSPANGVAPQHPGPALERLAALGSKLGLPDLP